MSNSTPAQKAEVTTEVTRPTVKTKKVKSPTLEAK